MPFLLLVLLLALKIEGKKAHIYDRFVFIFFHLRAYSSLMRVFSRLSQVDETFDLDLAGVWDLVRLSPIALCHICSC